MSYKKIIEEDRKEWSKSLEEAEDEIDQTKLLEDSKDHYRIT